MLVRDMMERTVVTLDLESHLDLVEDLMGFERIRHMPVVSGGCLVGIVTQRDLFRAGISSVLQLGWKAERDWLEKVRLAEVMSPAPVTIDPDAPLLDAVELMLEKQVGCLPVVEHERVVGIVSETDCMRHLARVLRIAERKQALPELPRAL